MQIRFLWRGLTTYFRSQRCELRALQSALRPGDIAVDVGANKGSYLWGLSRAVPRGKVVAFEPQPDLAQYLQAACASNGLNNVSIENAGVSERTGRLPLAIPDNKKFAAGASFEARVLGKNNWGKLEVAAYSLDDYFANETRRIGAIKIDVEGHELSVLRGATKLIEKHSPLIVCECESRNMTQGNVATVLDWFKGLSYDGHFVHRQRLLPIADFKPAVHQAQVGKRYFAHPDYCNNFILKRAG